MNRTATVALITAVILSGAFALYQRATRVPLMARSTAVTDDERPGEDSSPGRASGRQPQVLVLPVPDPERRAEAPAASAEPEGKAPEQIAAELEEAFRTDRPADASSTRMQGGISGAFQNDERAKGAVIRQIDCRGTRCRLAVDFENEAANNRVMIEMFTMLAAAGVDTTNLAFTIPTRTVDGDGKVNAVVHLYRVPDPAPAAL
jgi:hypothetical protein